MTEEGTNNNTLAFEKCIHLHKLIIPGGITPKLQVRTLTRRGWKPGQEPTATGACVLETSMDYFEKKKKKIPEGAHVKAETFLMPAPSILWSLPGDAQWQAGHLPPCGWPAPMLVVWLQPPINRIRGEEWFPHMRQ